MILRIFSVRDSATSQFGNPMFLIADGQAIRSFQDEVNSRDKDSYISKHPEHFDLYGLGTFDTDSGVFVSVLPTLVISGSSALVRN